MNRRNPQLKDLDRQMNLALKGAKTPSAIFAVKAEFADKRRRVLSGEYLPERIANPPAQPARVEYRIADWSTSWRPMEIEVDQEALMRVANSIRAAGAAMAGGWDISRSGARSFTWTAGFFPEETEERKAAKVRAEEYLLAHLDEAQKETYHHRHFFEVRNKASKRLWRIRTNTTVYNVDAIGGDGKKIASFCGIPSGQWVPPCDIYLAQKMLLETDEAEFLIKANRQSAFSTGLLAYA